MDQKSKEILKDYEVSLEDLTFNSKPIINMLTMLADKHKSLASDIVELIETRFFKVRPEYRLPTLYLMDSVIKNLGGEYLQLISKNVVRVFCEAFQSLTDPKARVSLYKLRQTWASFIAVKKLAAIDQHIHAMDPNWPITARQEDPQSPTIFVNPKFLGPGDKASSSRDQGRGSIPRGVNFKPLNNKLGVLNVPVSSGMGGAANKMVPPSRQATDIRQQRAQVISKRPSPTVSSKGPTPITAKGEEGLDSTATSIQDKRRRLKESLKQKKLDTKRAMGLLPPSVDEHTPPQEEEPHPSSMEFMKTLNPIPKKKKRSVSPNIQCHKPREDIASNSQSPVRSKQRMKSLSPSPPIKSYPAKAKSRSNSPAEPEIHENRKHKLDTASGNSSSEEQSTCKQARLDEDEKPLHPAILDLEDLPPELFADHQSYILAQAERRLESGKLSKEEHDALVKQVQQLYDLQKMKNQNNQSRERDLPDNSHSHHSPSPPPPHPHHSPSPSPPHPHHPPSPPPPHTYHPPSSPPPPLQSHIHHPPSPPHPPSYSSVPPPDIHHGPRPTHAYHSKFEDKFPPHPPRGGHRHPMSNRDNFRPPRFSRRGPPRHSRPWGGRGFPPPGNRPHYEEYPTPRLQSEEYPPPPPQAPPSGPPRDDSSSVDISMLYKQLQQSGLFSERVAPTTGDAPAAKPLPPPCPVIPEIQLSIGAIRRRYDNLVELLLRGEPCTSCGLRFTGEEKEDYQRHLDWHYSENRIEKEGTKNTSRNWNTHFEDWLTLDGNSLNSRDYDPGGGLGLEPEVKEESVAREEESAVSCKVLPGEDSEFCSLCHEPLEQFWEEDEEEWHFKEAIRTPDNQLFHSYCYLDYKETVSTPMETDDKSLSDAN